ncbi:ORF1 [Anelloviridae sp.]|nr:ORF1 [Anelloviridae sp.]
MPFWWRRRNRPWYSNNYRRRRRRRYRRRRFPRRRARRTFKRRRRRRYTTKKVKRKKKKIFVQQWQPDRIVKCKIIGLGCSVWGADGRQFLCYTNEKTDYVQPRAPGGGGFGADVFTLEYLYQQYKAHNCIWTTSNDYTDLCRYTGCKFTIYRHPDTDFIINYQRQPPFNISKYTYTSFHPHNMLLQKHKRILLSLKSNPRGKRKVTLRIKPPKMLTTKWYFQENFTNFPLCQIAVSAANFNYARVASNGISNVLSLYSLNIEFYQYSDWAQKKTGKPYKPYLTIPDKLKFHYKDKSGTEKTIEVTCTTYDESISYTKGWFQKFVLSAYKVTLANKQGQEQQYAHLPIVPCRYNPDADTGDGNELWVCSILNGSYDKPRTDPVLVYQGQPLWMMLYGYWSYVLYVKKDKNFFKAHMFVLRSKAIKLLSTTSTQQTFPIVDLSFIQGNMPYNEYLSDQAKNFWYPTAEKQVESINAIVESGPYVPKYTNTRDSTWEANYKYCFYFKWGGPHITDQPVADPATQGNYDIPSHLQGTVQITDPRKQKAEAMFHPWDFRRGFITPRALKRMSENISITSDGESDDSPVKKAKITTEIPFPEGEAQNLQACLHSLFEENTFQETQETDVLQLINQQQQQQQQLKNNLLQLLIDMRRRQRMLQLQAGILD